MVAGVEGTTRMDAVLIQPDGRIVVVGTLGDQFAVWRFMSNGELDASFGADGGVAHAFPRRSGALAAALQPDGRIVLAGHAGARMAVARLLPGRVRLDRGGAPPASARASD